MTNEEREEWYQDLKEEKYQEEVTEHRLRSDYDYFEQYFEEEIADLFKAIKKVREYHEEYGWTMELNDFL
jgi:hypothetical protein